MKAILARIISLIMSGVLFLGNAIGTFEAWYIPSRHYDKIDVPSLTELSDAFHEAGRSHPYLMATAEDFTRLKAQIVEDEASAGWYAALYGNAVGYLSVPVWSYIEKDHGDNLGRSEGVRACILTSAMAYKISGEERFAQRIWDEVLSMNAYPTWDPNDHALDTAAMAFSGAIAYDWLYDYWNAQQRETLESMLLRLSIGYMEEQYDADAYWFTDNDNWNSVILGGNGVAAAAIYSLYPERCGKMLRIVLSNITHTMSVYGKGGVFPEGPSYWSFATEYNVFLRASLETGFGTDFGLSEMPGVRECAFYPLLVSNISIGKTFNFGDAQEYLPTNDIMFWLAKKYNAPVLAKYELGLVGEFTALRLLWYDPEVDYDSIDYTEELGTTRLLQSKRSTHEDVAILCNSRTDPNSVFAAIKSGWNRSGHSDLDIGTFVLDALGERWFCDLGSDSYSLSSYFSKNKDSTRYTYYRKRAEGNNTIVINPSEDCDQYKSADVHISSFSTSAEESYATINMTEAYLANAYSVKRGIKLFHQSQQVLIQDEIKCYGDSDIYWSAHTEAQIEISADGKTAILSKNGKQLKAQLVSLAEGGFSVTPAGSMVEAYKDNYLYSLEPYSKLNVHLEDTSSTTVAIVFTPVTEGSGALPLPGIEPIRKW